jgi:hypothetical protein
MCNEQTNERMAEINEVAEKELNYRKRRKDSELV